ncbi:MAG: prepilin-type N-terminal cleavage/methylation domain-containing protein [Candidatus Aceula lacicola]|nr:prepilin-type N-terminal cleavage/methylation domain-containing protein [Candidatus Aceula lacicola]
MKKNQLGFTLVEIMISVAIIALLASIAIPGILRAKMVSNEALARSSLKAMSTASELYALTVGIYPQDIASLTDVTPPYINSSYCSATISGYEYSCTFSASGYSLRASPFVLGQTGTVIFRIDTGGVLVP